MLGAVTSHAGDHRHPAIYHRGGKPNDFQMLLIGHGGSFPRGSGYDNGVGMVCKLVLQQRVKYVVINGASSFMGVTMAVAQPRNTVFFMINPLVFRKFPFGTGGIPVGINIVL